MPLRLAIIGGGIGGLSLAVALSRLATEHQIEVDIYESASQLTQIGAGITIWPRTWKILESLGLANELLPHLATGQHIPDGIPRLAFQFRKADQKQGLPIRDLIFSGAPLSFHRAVVQEVLLKHLSPSFRVHLASQLVSYSIAQDNCHSTSNTNAYSAPIQLVFADGRTATCDVLVGADGIKSRVRKQLALSAGSDSAGTSANGRPYAALSVDDHIADPVWSGSIAFRFTVDSAALVRDMPHHRALTTHAIYCGKNQHVVAYPILQGRVVGVSAYVSDFSKEGTKWNGPTFEDVTREDVILHFDSWDEEVRLLALNAQKPSRWAIHAINPLESYISPSKNIILLGDAAHAMTPHQGNGAGQAIEDAYILGHLISSVQLLPTAVSIPKIAEVYDAIRRPAANLVQSLSRRHGFLYEFNFDMGELRYPGDSSESADSAHEDGPDEGRSWSEEDLRRLGDTIVGDWTYAWETTAEPDRERALDMIR